MISCRWAELFSFLWAAIHCLVGYMDIGVFGFGVFLADHFDDNSCQARGIGTAMVPACAPRVFDPWGRTARQNGTKRRGGTRRKRTKEAKKRKVKHVSDDAR